VKFGEDDTASQIMASSEPDQQKQLGRQLTCDNNSVWMEVLSDVVKKANFEKVIFLLIFS